MVNENRKTPIQVDTTPFYCHQLKYFFKILYLSKSKILSDGIKRRRWLLLSNGWENHQWITSSSSSFPSPSSSLKPFTNPETKMAASTIRTPPPTSLSFFSSSLFHISKPLTLSLSKPNSLNPQFKHLSISCQAATLPILSFTGEKIGETYLDLKSAPPETARAVVHRAIITDQQNKRRGTASTLTRAEVRGGGRKPLQQKGTGRARRGSTRTPLRPGGGVIFGPKPRDWTIKINRKEKKLAISTALWSAVENMICVEEFGGKFEKPKTKDFIEAMRRWGMEPSEKVMFLMMDVDENVGKSSRNIGGLRMLTPRSLNMFDILNSDKVVLTPDTVDFLNGRYGVQVEDDDEEEEGELVGDGGN